MAMRSRAPCTVTRRCGSSHAWKLAVLLLCLDPVEKSHAQGEPPADRRNLWTDEIDRRLNDLGVLFTCAAPACADCDRACRECEGRWEQAATAAEPLQVLDVSEPVNAPTATGSLWINAAPLAPGESVVLTLRSDQISDANLFRLRFMDQAVGELLTASRVEPWAAGEAQISVVNAHASDSSPASFGLAFVTAPVCDDCAACGAASCGTDGLGSCAAAPTLPEGMPTSVYSVSLLSAPSTEPVAVAADFTSTCGGVSVTPKTLMFFLSSWNEPQEVSVVFADDWIHVTPECEIVVTHTASSEDGNYAEIEKSVYITAAVEDRDDALIYALPDSMVIQEGGDVQSYDVRLSSPPGCSNCTGYHLRMSGQDEPGVPVCLSLSASPPTPTLQQRECAEEAAAMWHVNHDTADSTFWFSSSLAPDLCLKYDQSSEALTLAPCENANAANDLYFLQQSADPDLCCSTVNEAVCFYMVASSVTVIPQGFGEHVVVSPASLRFSSTDWRAPQRVTVEVANDDYADGRRNVTIEHLVVPRIGDPITTRASVSVVIEDNDILRAHASISQMEMGENSSRTYTVQLAAKPREETAISLRSASGMRDGSTYHRAARSCMDLLRDFPQLTTGIYWVNPSAAGTPFQVACDMETEGGGWYALSVQSDLLPESVVVAQRFDGNPWHKCSDDAARHYQSLSSENDVVPVPLEETDQNVTQQLFYSSAFAGGELNENQIAAIRNQVTELSTSSRIVVSIADDSGYEVVAVDADGNEKHLNPGSPTSCGDSNGAVGNTVFYWWHNTAALSHGDEVVTPLAQSFILPTAVRMTVPSSGGGGASFGWENSIILVRPGRSDLRGCSQVEYASSCSALRSSGIMTSGVYTIDVDSQGGEDPFEVYCDMSTDGGGWTIIFKTGCVVDVGDTQNLCAPQPQPDRWEQFALSAGQQNLLGTISTESLVRRSDGAWLKTSSAFTVDRETELAPMVRIQAVNITSGTTVVPGFQSATRDGAEFGVYSSDFDSFADATTQCGAAYLQKSGARQAFEIGAGVGSWTVRGGCTIDQEPLAFYVALRGPSLQAGCGAQSCPSMDTTCANLSSGRHICHRLSVDLAQQSNMRFEPQVLSFSESTWDVPQIVSIIVADNDVQQAEAAYGLDLLHTVVGTTDRMTSDSKSTVVRVNVIEDDVAGLKIIPEATRTQESCQTRESAATWVVSLSSAPVRDVIIALELPDTAVAVPAFIFFPAAGSEEFCSDANANDIRARLASFSLIASAIVEHVDRPDEYLRQQAIAATCPELRYSGPFDTEAPTAILVVAILLTPISSVALDIKAFLDALGFHLDLLPAQLQFVHFDADEQQIQVMVKQCAHAQAWNLPQRVGMTVVDDERSFGDRQVAVVHRLVTEDPMYACEGHTFVAIVADDDEAELRVLAAPSKLHGSGHVDTLSITLTAQPSAEVVVSCQASENLHIGESSIAFSTTDYAHVKSFMVAAVQDSANLHGGIGRGEIILNVRSDDPAFDGITAQITVDIENDESALASVMPANLQLIEGGATSFSVVLHAAPKAPVYALFSSQLLHAQTAFAIDQWQTDELHGWTGNEVTTTGCSFGRVLKVSGAHAHVEKQFELELSRPAQMPIVVVATIVAIGKWDGNRVIATINGEEQLPTIIIVPPDAAATCGVDNEAALTVSVEFQVPHPVMRSTVQVRFVTDLPENVPASFGLVEVALRTTGTIPDICTGARPGPFSVLAGVITPESWHTPANLHIVAIDDATYNSDRSELASVVLCSEDEAFNIDLPEIAVIVANDEVQSVFTDLQSLSVAEGGQGSYLMWLGSEPSSDVRVEPNLPGIISASFFPSEIVFARTTWNVPQRVTLSINADLTAPAHRDLTGWMVHSASSADPGYDEKQFSGLAVNVIDRDSAGLTIRIGESELVLPTVLSVVEGANMTFSLSLHSKPLRNVEISLSLSGHSGTSVRPQSLAFDQESWATPQTATVAAARNNAAGRQEALLEVLMQSEDLLYADLKIPPLRFHVVDDDFARIVAEDTVSLREGDTEVDVCFDLETIPAAPVTVVNASVFLLSGCLDTLAVNYDERVSQHDGSVCQYHHRAAGSCGVVSIQKTGVTQVELAGDFTRPVLFIGPSEMPTQGAIKRDTDGCLGWCIHIRRVSEVPTPTALHWMVLESGSYRSGDRVPSSANDVSDFAFVQVGARTLPSHTLAGWPVAFYSPFLLPPVVLTYPQATAAGATPMATRVSTANFHAIADVSASSIVPAGYVVGWLALDPGRGLFGGMPFEASRHVLSTTGLNFETGYSGSPLVFANAQMINADKISPLCVTASISSGDIALNTCTSTLHDSGSGGQASQPWGTMEVSVVSVSGSGDLLMVPDKASRCRVDSFLCECFAHPARELLGSGCEDAPQYSNMEPFLLPAPCQQFYLHSASSFSARWRGEIRFDDGAHTFLTTSSDTSTLLLDNKRIIVNDDGCCATLSSTPQRLHAGIYSVQFEAMHTGYNNWFATLAWECTDRSPAIDIPLHVSTAAGQGINITVGDGQSVASSTAGFHIVIVNPSSGALDSFASFDTSTASGAMAMRAFLQFVPVGCVVLMSTYGHTGRHASLAATQLRELGAPELPAVDPAFVMIGCKLCTHHHWLQHAVPVDGVADVDALIPASLHWSLQDILHPMPLKSQHAALDVDIASDLTMSVGSATCLTASAERDNIDELSSTYSVQLQTESDDAVYDGAATVHGIIHVIDESVQGSLRTSLNQIAAIEGLNVSYQMQLSSKPEGDVDIALQVVRSGQWATQSEAVCHTAKRGDVCFENVQWAREIGILASPSRYPCLTRESSFEDFQFFLYSCCPETLCAVPCRVDTDIACAASPDSAWSGGLYLSQTTMRFNPENWNVSQTVVVQAPNDDVDMGVNYSFAIEHIASSTDMVYNGLVTRMRAVVEDNDVSDVVLAPTAAIATGTTTLVEGSSYTYTIALQSEPLDLVSIFIATNLMSGVEPRQFDIWPHKWNVPYNVTLTMADDRVDRGDRRLVVSHMIRTSDSNFRWDTSTGLQVNVSDNDVAGISIIGRQQDLTSRTDSLFVSESGVEAAYEISLSSQPLEDVVVSMQQEMRHGYNQLRFTPANWTFTSANWNESRTVRISAIDDAIDEGMNSSVSVWHTTTSVDPMYSGVLGQLGILNVTVEDDDTAEVRSSQLELIVREGAPSHGAASAAVACSALLDDVDTPYVLCGGECAPKSLCDAAARQECVDSCFAAEHWVAVHSISVLGQDACRARCLEYGVDSMDYRGNGNCSCLSLRGDMPVHQVVQHGSIGECTLCSNRFTSAADLPDASLFEARYELFLGSEPLDDVNVSITPKGGLLVQPSWALFSPSNWFIPQSINISAINDRVAERFEVAEVLHRVSHSHDRVYGSHNFEALSVNVTISDDDTAMVHLSTSRMELNETGTASATYKIWLNSPPQSQFQVNVTIHFDEAEIRVEPPSLTFDSNCWSEPQLVNVTAKDDRVDTGNNSKTVITHGVRSADEFYNGIFVRNISVTLFDDDVAQVRVARYSGIEGNVTEGGADDRYDITLKSEPTADVVVYVYGPGLELEQLHVSPQTLRFTRADWNVTRWVNVSAIDDDVAEGPTRTSLHHNVSSADPWYDGTKARSFTVLVSDNEVARVNETVQTETTPNETISVTEGAQGERICLTLTAEPLALVVVRPFVQLWTEHEGNTSGEWVGGLVLVDCDASPPSLHRTVELRTSNTSGLWTLDTDLYGDRNTSLPISWKGRWPSQAMECAGTALAFAPDMWDTPACFDVLALEDHVDEDPFIMRMGYTVTSSAVLYNENVTQWGAKLSIDDNDDAGMELSVETDPFVSESGVEAAYEISLSSQPLEDVVVSMQQEMRHGYNQLRFTPANWTFTSANWNESRTVRISAIDDAIDEGMNSSVSVWHTTTSVDPMYSGVLGQLGILNVTVEDDDTAGFSVYPRSIVVIGELVASEKMSVPMFVQLPDNHSVVDADRTCAAMGMVLADFRCESPATPLAVTSANCVAEAPGYCLHTVSDYCTSNPLLSVNASDSSTPANATDSSTPEMTAEELRSSPLWPLCMSGTHVYVPKNGSVAATAHVFPSVIVSVVLNTEPLDNVAVALTVPGHDIWINPNSTTFTRGDWDLPQFVVIGARDDFSAEPREDTHTVFASSESADKHYRIGEKFVVNSTVIDNDEYSLIVDIDPRTEVSPGTMQLHEGSASAEEPNAGSYELSLGSKPSEVVTVRIEVSELYRNDILVSDASGDPIREVTFTSRNWNIKQSVYLTAVNDCQDERLEKVLIVNTLTVQGRGDFVQNISVALMDDDVLEEPAGYEIFHPRAGPLTGETIIELAANVVDENAFGTNLRMGGLDIRCRFTDQYGIYDETTGFSKENILQTFTQPDTCFGSAKIACITPSWPAEAEVDVEVSIDGGRYVPADRKFQFYRFETIAASPLLGPDTGGTLVSVHGTPDVGYTPSFKFGNITVPGVRGEMSIASCESPKYLSSALSDCEAHYSSPVHISLNGQQFSPLGNFVYYSRDAPCLHGVDPASGPLDGGTNISVSFAAPFLPGAIWSCQFMSSEGNNTALGTVSYLQGHRQLTCVTPPLAVSNIQLRATLNGQQYSTRSLNFSSYERPTVSSMSSADSNIWPKVSVDIRSLTPIELTGVIASSDAAAVRLWPQGRSNGEWVEFNGLRASENTLNFTMGNAVGDLRLIRAGADARVLISLNGQQYDDTGQVLSLFNLSTPAVLQSAKPASGTKEGGTTVKLTGMNFAGLSTLQCRFVTPTSTEVKEAMFESSRLVSCETPPNYDRGQTVPADAVLAVTNDDSNMDLWSLEQSFRYTATSPPDCTARGPGVDSGRRLRAGDWASFSIFAKTTEGTPRENGGDQFYVNLASDHNIEYTGFVIDLDAEYYEPASWPSSINQTMVHAQQYVAVDGPGPQPANSGSYLGLYNVTRSGSYEVSIASGGVDIFNSPFVVQVFPSDFDVENSLFERTEGRLQRSTAGETVTFDLYYRDRYGNYVNLDPSPAVEVWFEGIGGVNDVIFSIEKLAVYHASATVTATVAADYQAHCLVNDVSALGSDISFAVEAARASSMRSAEQLEATLVVNATDALTSLFTLVIRDQFDNVRSGCIYLQGELLNHLEGQPTTFCDDLQVSATHASKVKPDGSPLKSLSKPTVSALPGHYIVQFKPLVAGTYNLTVQLNGVALALEAATATVRPAQLAVEGPFTTGRGSNVTRPLSTVVAGAKASFQIDGRDRYGNLRDESDGPYQVQLRLRTDIEERHMQHTVEIESEPIPESPGSHTVSYTATVSGFYDVHVFHSDKLLYWSPVNLNRDEGILRIDPAVPDANQSEAWAQPGVTAGFTSTCLVRLKDRFGNPTNGDKSEEERISARIESADLPTFWKENKDQIPWRFAIRADGTDNQDGTFENDLTGCCEDDATCEVVPPCRPAEKVRNGVYVLHYKFYPWLDYNLKVALSSCEAKSAADCNVFVNATACRTAEFCSWDGSASSCSETTPIDCNLLASEGRAGCESSGRCLYSEDALGGGNYSNETLHTQPSRAPRALRAQFDDSLVRINVDFDISTNQARTVAEDTDCGNIFGHDSVFTWLLNGKGDAKCTWRTDTSLRIALGYMSKVTTTEAAASVRDANVAVYNAEYSIPDGNCIEAAGAVQADVDACAAVADLGDDAACLAVQRSGTSDGVSPACTYTKPEVWNGNMTFTSPDQYVGRIPSWKGHPYPLTSSQENSKLCTGELTIDGPNTPLVPVARIDAPVQVGLCEAVVAKGSNSYGGGPRPLSYSWTALSRGDQAMPSLNLDVMSVDVGANSVTLVGPHSVTAGQQLLLQHAPERTCEAAPTDQPLTVLSVDGAVVTFGPSCTGTAADGVTDCRLFFANQAGTAESDCTAGDGSGCLYTNGILIGDPNAAENCIVGFTLSAYLHNMNMQVGEAGSMGQDQVVLSRNDTIAGARYNFQLEVTNFLGEKSQDAVVIRKLEISVPNVEIMAGDRRDVLRSSAVLLQGTANLPQADCVPPSWRVMSYSWAQVDNGAPILALSASTRSNKDLYLPRDTLSTYYTFHFKLEAWPSVAPDAKNFAEAWVTVLPEDLVADIVGGSNRIVGSDSSVSLDGSSSQDPSDVAANMTFEWSCQMPYQKPRAECTSAQLTGQAASCPSGCQYTSPLSASPASCVPVDADACQTAVLNGSEVSCTGAGNCAYTPADDEEGIAEVCLGIGAATCEAVDVDSPGAAGACANTGLCVFSAAAQQVEEACSFPDFLNQTVGPCVDRSLRLLNFTADAMQTIPAETLFFESGAGLEHVFILTIVKESNVSGIHDRRNASTETRLYVVPGDPPQVSIASLPQAKVNAQERLVLQGEIYSKRPSTIGYTEYKEHNPTKWTVSKGLLNLTNPRTTTTGQFGPDYTSSVNLVISPGALVPGQEYRLRLDAHDEYGAGYAMTTFIVNTAPSSGALRVEPTNGVALNTTFVATMDGWADDPVDLPLVYRFSYLLDGKESNVGNFAEVSSASMILPTGDDQNSTVNYHLMIIGYVADRFGASARAEFTVSVRPPNITLEAVDAFAADTMDSVCDKALALGYAEKASACLGAAMKVVNQVPAEVRRRRRLAEADPWDVDASEAPIRDRFVDSMVAAGAGTTPTDINTQTSLDLAASATSASDELSKNATRKSLDFVGDIVAQRAEMDTTAGATTTVALSNVASAWMKPADGAQNETEGNDRTDRQDTILSDTNPQDHRCPNDCNGRGSCIMGECLCDTYECTIGHCIREPYAREPGVAYLAEDECSSTTCYRYTCSRGMCKPFEDSCYEGSCSFRRDGESHIDCYPGTCSTYQHHYALPDCALTPEAKLASALQQRREDKAMSSTLSTAVQGLASAVLADRVRGERSVDFETEMIKSTSLRASPTDLSTSSGFATPAAGGGASASISIPESLFSNNVNMTGGLHCADNLDCSEPRGKCVFAGENSSSSLNGSCVCEVQYTGPNCAKDAMLQLDVDLKATQWGTNIYGFSGTSAGIKSTITSIELSVSTDSSPEPFMIGIPTSPPAEVGGAACTVDANCTAPRGHCSIDEGVCVCAVPYTGSDCSDTAVCKFWDTVQERFSSDGCVVADVKPTVTMCNCTHLTDFAAFEEEWLPQMNFVNPFDPALLAAFMADPRNIVVLILLITLYSMWIIGTIWGYKKDQSDRHQLYMQEIAVKFGGKVDQWSGTQREKAQIVLPEDDVAELQRKEKEAEDKERRRMKRRQRKLEKRRDELRSTRDAVHRDPEMLAAIEDEIADLMEANLIAQQGNACVRQARRFCGWCKGLGPAMGDGIAEAHPWASVIFVNADDRFTRPQRAAVLFCVIFGTIALGAFLMEGPRCMPEDSGYPNCAGWQECLLDCQDDGDADGTDRRLLSNETNSSVPGVPPCSADDEAGEAPSCVYCINRCLAAAEAAAGGEEEEEEMEEGAWKKIITTACIVSVLMLPADRLFVAMFEQVTEPAKDAHARGTGGREWSLPDLQEANKGAVMKIQAAFRGRLARKRQVLLRKKPDMERSSGGQAHEDGVASDSKPVPGEAQVANEAPVPLAKHVAQDTTVPVSSSDDQILPGVPETTVAVQGSAPPSIVTREQAGTITAGTKSVSTMQLGESILPEMPRGAVDGPARRPLVKKYKPKDLAGLTVSHQSTRHGIVQRIDSRAPPAASADSATIDGGDFDAILDAPPHAPPDGSPPKAVRKRGHAPSFARSRPQVQDKYEITEGQLTGLDKLRHHERGLTKFQASWRGMLVRRRLRAEWEEEERLKANRRARIRHRIRIAGKVALATTGKERALKRGRRRRRIAKVQDGEEDEEDEGFPRWFMGVTYAACVLWCLICGLYTLAICVYFGPVASLEWLLCCFSASGFEAFVQDPLKIAIVVILGDQSEYLVDLYLEFMDYMPFQL